jgi:hypothetical protein
VDVLTILAVVGGMVLVPYALSVVANLTTPAWRRLLDRIAGRMVDRAQRDAEYSAWVMEVREHPEHAAAELQRLAVTGTATAPLRLAAVVVPLGAVIVGVLEPPPVGPVLVVTGSVATAAMVALVVTFALGTARRAEVLARAVDGRHPPDPTPDPDAPEVRPGTGASAGQ